MSKYEPLETFLAGQTVSEVPMKFGEIETLIGAPLPPVARKHRAWWSNNPSNSVITRSWLNAGFKTERVDMGSEKLTFRRAEGPDRSGGVSSPKAVPPGGIVAAVRAALAGTVRVAPGVDLTAPTGEIWEADSE